MLNGSRCLAPVLISPARMGTPIGEICYAREVTQALGVSGRDGHDRSVAVSMGLGHTITSGLWTGPPSTVLPYAVPGRPSGSRCDRPQLGARLERRPRVPTGPAVGVWAGRYLWIGATGRRRRGSGLMRATCCSTSVPCVRRELCRRLAKATVEAGRWPLGTSRTATGDMAVPSFGTSAVLSTNGEMVQQ